jgi:ubiquinone/menaquinone biosynthesis C-methylase UbiE
LTIGIPGERATLRLLPRRALLRTGVVDHADWNYRLLLGWIQRLRFRLVVALLPPGRVGQMLEIGYGSGVFLPELARHCWELHGTDRHHHADAVQESLARFGVNVRLQSAPAERQPFASSSFDVVVAVSVLEFVDDVDAACREVRRVLRPEGHFVVVTPGPSRMVSTAASLLSGKDANRDFGRRRERIRPALARHFARDRVIRVPPLGGGLLRLYDAYRLAPLPIEGLAADVAGSEREAEAQGAPAMTRGD